MSWGVKTTCFKVHLPASQRVRKNFRFAKDLDWNELGGFVSWSHPSSRSRVEFYECLGKVTATGRNRKDLRPPTLHWVVVSNIVYFHPYFGGMIQFD